MNNKKVHFQQMKDAYKQQKLLLHTTSPYKFNCLIEEFNNFRIENANIMDRILSTCALDKNFKENQKLWWGSDINLSSGNSNVGFIFMTTPNEANYDNENSIGVLPLFSKKDDIGWNQSSNWCLPISMFSLPENIKERLRDFVADKGKGWWQRRCQSEITDTVERAREINITLDRTINAKSSDFLTMAENWAKIAGFGFNTHSVFYNKSAIEKLEATSRRVNIIHRHIAVVSEFITDGRSKTEKELIWQAIENRNKTTDLPELTKSISIFPESIRDSGNDNAIVTKAFNKNYFHNEVVVWVKFIGNHELIRINGLAAIAWNDRPNKEQQKMRKIFYDYNKTLKPHQSSDDYFNMLLEFVSSAENVFVSAHTYGMIGYVNAHIIASKILDQYGNKPEIVRFQDIVS